MNNILRFGWSTINPTLGFPFGGDVGLEPIYPTDTVLLARTLAPFTDDPIVASNLFVYLSHVVNVLLAYGCLRVLRIGQVGSLLGAISFAFLEFAINPNRVNGHQTLALFGALAVAGTLSLLPFRWGRPWPGWLFAVSAFGAFVVGLSHPYYVAFATMAISLSGLMLLTARRFTDASFSGAMLLVIAIVTAAAWFGPTVLADNDVPYTAPQRHWAAQSHLGLRVPDLIMPPRSSIRRLQEVRQSYYSVMGGTFDTYLGPYGSFGAALAVLTALGIPIIARRTPEQAAAISTASLLALFVFVFGMTNGLGLLFSMTITSMLRGQDRIIPLLAFFCIYISACTVEGWLQAARGRMQKAVVLTGVTGIVSVALLDQMTGLSYGDLQASNSARFVADRNFITEFERKLPSKTAVLQLPPMFFPEDGTYLATGLNGYEQFRGPTYASNLRWSYGLSYDNEGYLSQLGKDTRGLLKLGLTRGFGAVLIYKDGYQDHGAAISRDISEFLHAEALIETNHYVAFYLPPHPAGSDQPHPAGSQRLACRLVLAS